MVRAKAGRAQSQHDKKGGHAQSAGAQIRRHNEAMLAQVSSLLSMKFECLNCLRDGMKNQSVPGKINRIFPMCKT